MPGTARLADSCQIQVDPFGYQWPGGSCCSELQVAIYCSDPHTCSRITYIHATWPPLKRLRWVFVHAWWEERPLVQPSILQHKFNQFHR